jgi:hypothetical protein
MPAAISTSLRAGLRVGEGELHAAAGL